MSPSSSLSIELSNVKMLLLDNLLILTYIFLALSKLLTGHTKCLNISVFNSSLLIIPQNFPTLSYSDLESFSKICQTFPIKFSIK